MAHIHMHLLGTCVHLCMGVVGNVIKKSWANIWRTCRSN